MSDSAERTFSRRQWVAAVSAPVAAAAALGTMSAVGQDLQPAANPQARDLGAKIYNIRDFGAKGDGKSLDTAAIQAAIDACTRDQGGTVLVPAGTFVIGPIELKDNVTLHISAGGTLLGTADGSQYHPARGIPLAGDHTMGDGNVGLVYGANAKNVTIEGPGTIDGQGGAAKLSGKGRAHLVLFYKCTNLTIRDVYMFRSGYHTCRICNSSYVYIDGVRINCRTVGNNDGFHFISAEYVNMTNCNVRCQDDACALFGSCKFITITNCSFSTRWSVFRFGGGVAENIAVSNCLMYQVLGCVVKMRCEPGSRYENMSFSNLVFQEVTGPISIGAGPQSAGRGGRPAAPAESSDAGNNSSIAIVRNISFSNISGSVTTKKTKLADSTVSGGTNPGEQRSCIIVNCVEGNLVENISFSDIDLTFGGGGTAEDAQRRELPNIAAEYYALGPMPAYGFYSRNARRLTLSNIRFQVAAPEARPAVILDKVRDAAIYDLSADANPEAESLVRLINTTDALISAPRVLSPASVFLWVEGADSAAITVDGGDISKAATPLAFAVGARQDSVKMRP